VEGDHDANDGSGEVTKIPTYGFAVGDTLYISYMSVNHWGDPGVWEANRAALAKSTDEGRTWTQLKAPIWPGDSNFVQVATAHVNEGGTEYVYFWGIPAGRFGSVQLMRVPAATGAVEDAGAYTYFAGTARDGTPRWSAKAADAKTVLEGTIGELSVMWSTYLDRWLMTYSDAGNAYIREGVTPWGLWGDPIEMASAADYPGLYSPYMSGARTTSSGSPSTSRRRTEARGVKSIQRWSRRIEEEPPLDFCTIRRHLVRSERPNVAISKHSRIALEIDFV
jgi:hypothetical protein